MDRAKHCYGCRRKLQTPILPQGLESGCRSSWLRCEAVGCGLGWHLACAGLTGGALPTVFSCPMCTGVLISPCWTGPVRDLPHLPWEAAAAHQLEDFEIRALQPKRRPLVTWNDALRVRGALCRAGDQLVEEARLQQQIRQRQAASGCQPPPPPEPLEPIRDFDLSRRLLSQRSEPTEAEDLTPEVSGTRQLGQEEEDDE